MNGREGMKTKECDNCHKEIPCQTTKCPFCNNISSPKGNRGANIYCEAPRCNELACFADIHGAKWYCWAHLRDRTAQEGWNPERGSSVDLLIAKSIDKWERQPGEKRSDFLKRNQDAALGAFDKVTDRVPGSDDDL